MGEGSKIYNSMRYILLPFLLLALCLPAWGMKTDTATAVMKKDISEIVVVGQREEQLRNKSGDAVSWSMQSLSKNVKTMGEADPLRYLQMLPGVQTGQDYATGIAVQGCDYSQTLVEMGGAPVFYPYHLFGVFSACNAGHFKRMNFEKSVHDGSFSNRLGGFVEMEPQNALADTLSGKVNVGLISSNINIAIPVGKKVSVIASARLSYMNLLYGSFMNDDTTATRYDFGDANITVLYKHDAANTVQINGYYGSDRLKVDESLNAITTSLGWSNGAMSVRWLHNGRLSWTQNAHYSWLDNRITFDMPQVWIKVPSSIKEAGYKGNFSYRLGDRWGDVSAGLDFALRDIAPQSAISTGYIADNTAAASSERSCETKFHAQWQFPISARLNATAGLKTTHYGTRNGFNNVYLDPFLTLRYTAGNNRFTLHGGCYRQFLHQVGFSDTGFPSNFWIEADATILPQEAKAVSAAFDRDLLNHRYSVSAEAYYKRISHDTEYAGYVFDMLQSDYNARRCLIDGSGYNAGVDIMLKKNTGRVTGWLSYSLGYARRHFPGKSNGYVPSSRESLHTVSVLVNYRIAPKWSASANFVFASGAPTTPLKSIYMVGENYINVSGAWHSARLPAYHRLDLSADYSFKGNLFGRQLRQSVNLSVVNAYAHKNVYLRYFRYEKPKGQAEQFKEKKLSSIYKVMPSLSYSVEF